MTTCRKILKGALLSALFSWLSGCASRSPGFDVLARSFDLLEGRSSVAAQPDPRFQYLRVDREGGGSVLLALGYVEPLPQGDVSVWYSADREVLRTQNGRIVALQGLPTAYFRVKVEPEELPWPQLRYARLDYQRVRDDPMSYRYGHRDALRVVSAAPPLALQGRLPADARWPAGWTHSGAAGVRWYREQMLQTTGAALWPDAWFAVMDAPAGAREAQVVYAYQCLGPTLCFHVQAWPQRGLEKGVKAP
jgi:hypothetical protein